MSDHAKPGNPLISRRTALTAAAGVGVTAAAASVTQIATASDKRAKQPADGPIVVRLRDLGSGRLDVFTGSRRVQVVDRDLAEQLARAASRA
jgi:hypothetical protein